MEFQKVESWLHTDGPVIRDQESSEILLRGQGIGNWMVNEGFMLGTTQFGTDMGPFVRAMPMDRGRTLLSAVEELAGRTYADGFQKAWVENYFDEDDIRSIKELGFNCVRLGLSARLFLEEGPGYTWHQDTFERLDYIIDLCEKYKLYVILDMHGACGGQSGVSCDDGPANRPYMFMSQENQQRTIELWKKLAERYQGRWIVAGYELLNEPISLPFFDGLIPQLTAFYQRCIAAIRTIDTRHMIFLQGTRFANRLEIFDHDFDPLCHNWVMVVHLYEKLPDLSVFGPMLEARDRLNVPVWIGETGGSVDDGSDVGDQWMAATFEMAMEYHMGYAVWAHKTVDTCTGAAWLFGYPMPEGMQPLVDYFYKGTAKPDYQEAVTILDQLLEAIKWKNCTVNKTRAAFELRRTGCKVPAACYDPEHEHRGTWKYALYTGFRREDRTHFAYEKGYRYPDQGGLNDLRPDKEKYLDMTHILVRLDQGDSVCYTVRELTARTAVRVTYCCQQEAEAEISCGPQEESVCFDKTEQGQKTVLTLEPAQEAVVRIQGKQGSLDLKSIEFVPEV